MSVRSRFAPLRNSRFRLLFLATAASGIGNWLAIIALGLDMYDRTHSGWWVGELCFANIVPGGLHRPPARAARRPALAQAADDRLRPRAGSPCSQRCRSRTRPARSSCWPSSAGIGNAFFRPAVLAGVPNLVSRASSALRTRCSSSSTGRRRRSGRCSAALLVAASGPHLAYVVNAATFAFSAAARRRSSPGTCCRASARSAAASGRTCRRGLPWCAIHAR